MLDLVGSLCGCGLVSEVDLGDRVEFTRKRFASVEVLGLVNN